MIKHYNNYNSIQSDISQNPENRYVIQSGDYLRFYSIQYIAKSRHITSIPFKKQISKMSIFHKAKYFKQFLHYVSLLKPQN